VEGTGSYGPGLTRALRASGIDVVEINWPDRAARRRRGKTDLVNAEAAARVVLSGQASIWPKTAGGAVESMRVLKIAKDSAVKARVQATNQLKSVLVNADAVLREQLAPLQPGRWSTAARNWIRAATAGAAHRMNFLTPAVHRHRRLAQDRPCDRFCVCWAVVVIAPARRSSSGFFRDAITGPRSRSAGAAGGV
jgi:transposase